MFAFSPSTSNNSQPQELGIKKLIDILNKSNSKLEDSNRNELITHLNMRKF